MNIKQKFLVVGLLAAFTMIVLLIMNNYVTQKTQNFNTVAIDISHVQMAMLMLRRNEKDFLNRKDSKYQGKFNDNYSKLEARLSELNVSAANVGIDTSKIVTIGELFTNYQQQFINVISIQKVIGFNPKDGLYGDLRQSVHHAESIINKLEDSKLLADMLQLRRNEKDFMLRFDIKYLDKFTNNSDTFEQDLQQSKHQQKEIVLNSIREYKKKFQLLVAKQQEMGLSSQLGILGEMRNTVHETEKLLNELSMTMNSIVEQEIGSIDGLILKVMVLGSLLTLTILSVMAWIAIGILKKINILSTVMIDAADNSDLSLRIEVNGTDEMSMTCLAFNHMLKKFNAIIDNVHQSAIRITSTTTEMTKVTEQTNNGIQEQENKTTMLVEAINSMVSTVNNVATYATDASKAAIEADLECKKGQKVVDITSKTIQSLSSSIGDASDAIHKVEGDSEKIGTVVDVIRGIAEQTNLLALNAAIEAARAGEQGRGFAVVADEVRTLAQRTQESTEQIKEIIDRLQSQAQRAVTVIGDTKGKTDQSVQSASDASTTLVDIVDSVTNIRNVSHKITKAITEQSNFVNDVKQSVNNISNVALNTKNTTQESVSATKNISNEISRLTSLMDKFTT